MKGLRSFDSLRSLRMTGGFEQGTESPSRLRRQPSLGKGARPLSHFLTAPLSGEPRAAGSVWPYFIERRTAVTEIPDDPIIRCMERTGYPPWYRRKRPQYEDEQADEDACGEDDDG